MNLLNGSIKKMFFRYLLTAFGGSLISSIYGFVDMIVVGQYKGPVGTAALAVVAPVWNIIFSLGLLFGIGSSVIFSTLRGRAAAKGENENENEYFTVGLFCALTAAVAFWVLFIFADATLMRLFGADGTLLPLIEEYVKPIKFVIPAYLMGQFLITYLRNDSDPGLATLAVLAGGIFNVFGDVFFVFGLDMGMFGAGLATAIGSILTLLIMLVHFLKKRNTLRIVHVAGFFKKTAKVVTTGFPTFFVDVAMGIITVLMNKQVMKYAGTDALAIYGVIINISTCVQCCAYSVGQAAQPIISINFGAGKWRRIKELLKYALYATAFFSFVWTALSMVFPDQIVSLFMSTTDEVLQIAPSIIRTYALSFVLLPLNVFSTYYFQALLKPKTSFAISVARGCVISGGLILLMPEAFGGSAIWLAMPITELLTAFGAVYFMVKYTKKLGSVVS